MSERKILISRKPEINHPLLSKLGVPPSSLVTGGDPADLAGSQLVIIDCRVENVSGQVRPGGLLQTAVEAGTPVLLLQPSVSDLGALHGTAGLVPSEPKHAVLIGSRVNSAGIREHDISCLSYPAAPNAENSGTWGTSGDAAGTPILSCGCETSENETGEISPAALDSFAGQIEAAIERRQPAAASGPPTGLKYFKHSYTDEVSFRYKYDPWKVKNKSDGRLKLTWVIWGFLEQSEEGNKQYLAIEANHELQTGLPQWNDSNGRGFGVFHYDSKMWAYEESTNTYLGPYSHVPLSGTDAWTEKLKVPISYKDPVGGYKVWDFESSVTESLHRYKVESTGSGDKLGSTWYLYSPVNGKVMSEADWENAFTWYYKVKEFPSNYIGTLPTKSASVFRTSKIFSTPVKVAGGVWHAGGLPYGTFCTPVVCAYVWACWNGYYQGFAPVVDFKPIAP